MIKIVLNNNNWGIFRLSNEGMCYYADLKGITLYPELDNMRIVYWTIPPSERAHYSLKKRRAASFKERDAMDVFYNENTLSNYDFNRTDPDLVKTVQHLGSRANGKRASLILKEIKPGTRYRISDNNNDGRETIEFQDEYDWFVA